MPFEKKGLNKYKVYGDYTILYLKRKSGEVVETIIDTVDLELLKQLDWAWHAIWKKNTQSYYVRATVHYDGGIQKLYYLHRILLGITDIHIFVDHEDHNSLNNRRYNLRETNVRLNDSHRSGANKNNKTTGVRNVCYIEDEDEYWVQMMKKGERFRWVFPANQFDEACKFAEIKRQELFGEFAGEG